MIKEFNNENIKLNITAAYSAKQTKKILDIINKKLKLLYQFLLKYMMNKDPIPEFEKV